MSGMIIDDDGGAFRPTGRNGAQYVFLRGAHRNPRIVVLGEYLNANAQRCNIQLINGNNTNFIVTQISGFLNNTVGGIWTIARHDTPLAQLSAKRAYNPLTLTADNNLQARYELTSGGALGTQFGTMPYAGGSNSPISGAMLIGLHGAPLVVPPGAGIVFANSPTTNANWNVLTLFGYME